MALRPGDVGQRVVVRRVLTAELGPSGGPAMTDVLGVLEAWNEESLSVRRADGRVFDIAHADIVTAKPVPPRASVRQRVPAADLQRICSRGWQPIEQETLGDWLLRAAGGFTGRANSVLITGDPGLPTEQALSRVSRWYADRALPVLAQVTTDSPWLAELTSRGWLLARPDEGDVLVQVASVSQARRVRRVARPDVSSATSHQGAASPARWALRLDATPDDAWVRLYGRTPGVCLDVVLGVLTSGEQVTFASVQDLGTGVLEQPTEVDAQNPPAAGVTVAIGRGVRTGDWLGLAAVEVEPAYRRRGLGAAIVDALLEWGASHGALSTYLQTLPHNTAALGLYEPYGFRTHHSYRYLRPPSSS